MARIRSVKPEFWKSEAIACLPIRTRLTFIGLWTYVDDNGVGRDNARLIAAELYPLEEDPRETLANVQRDLDELQRSGRIVRYAVEGTAYLSIANWSEHQRIDKPNKARYPGPEKADPPLTSSYGDSRETVAESSREPRESPAPGAVELGNKGSGSREQRSSATPPPNGGALVKEHIDAMKVRPPDRVVGQTAKLVGELIAENIPENHIRAGLTALRRKSLHPSSLPSLVNEAMNPAAPKESTSNSRFAAGMEIAAQLESQGL